MKQIKLALVQFRPVFLQFDKNIEKALRFIDRYNADIYIFPELFLSGYNFSSINEVNLCAIDIANPESINTLLTLSQSRNIGICGGYIEKDNDSLYNSAFFIGDGSILSNYRKVHLFNTEKNFFSPSQSGFSIFVYKNIVFGLMICFDWLFPEASRSLALQGAQVILHPSNLVLPYAQKAMYARAIENKVFIATVNRVGKEKNLTSSLTFTGGSQIVDPKGNYLIQMHKSREYVKVVSINPDVALNKDITPLNNIFEDRRMDKYFLN